MGDIEYTRLESLIKKKQVVGAKRWLPTSVMNLENALIHGKFSRMNKALRKNIVYSLQYLQYIQLQLDDLHLTSVVENQLWKTYIVISMSIVEGVFYHLLIISGNQTKSKWEEIGRNSTNVYNEDGIRKKQEIVTYKELSSANNARMDFESMISKVRSKHLLTLPQKAYPYIKELKNIRNKVHLFIREDDYDTDFSRLKSTDYYLARYVLYRVLTDGVFENDIAIFDWIKPNSDILSSLTSILHEKTRKHQ